MAKPARDVAIIAFAQTPLVRREEARNEVEMLMPIVGQALDQAGLAHNELDFVCSGSSDYLAGQAFSFVMTLDSVGPWPPISESHVDMDGAWALYEAWVKMQAGTVDTALIYSYGKSSPGDIRRVLTRQLDPYYVAPLWPDSVALAALQAQACLDTGVTTQAEMAEVAARSRRAAASVPEAQLTTSADPESLLAEPMFVDPLRVHDCPPVTDGGAAIVLAVADKARQLCERPAWIRGIDHRIEPHALGLRDLTRSVSTEQAAANAGVADGKVDIAELHAPFTHQEVILAKALGLGDDTVINPSGGALAANVVMAAGLQRLGEAASRITRGEADRAVAHATSGPCLQQNLVCVLEGD
jgi:acetyl-CoA acetyltransferase